YETEWSEVSAQVWPQESSIELLGLSPGHWYQLNIKAVNEAGAGEQTYHFATLTAQGVGIMHSIAAIGKGAPIRGVGVDHNCDTCDMFGDCAHSYTRHRTHSHQQTPPVDQYGARGWCGDPR
ncbi:unnamed protein product, partial [Medioppia subpectinata]